MIILIFKFIIYLPLLIIYLIPNLILTHLINNPNFNKNLIIGHPIIIN